MRLITLQDFSLFRYGLDEVKHWNYETWNEPDHHKSSGMNWTLDEYLSYVDQLYIGFKSVSPVLRFGGPGTKTVCHQFFGGQWDRTSMPSYVHFVHRNSHRNSTIQHIGIPRLTS